ncbi:MAG: cation:proton antiporter [Campylobacteraceae bacterium]|nr:cation:proton antiporter [Campylobacteraceae bacterium]
MEIGAVIIFLAFLLAAAPFLSTFAKIPVIVVEMLLGVFGAYTGLLKGFEVFDMLAHLGFLYLMFLVGMEVDLKDFHFGKTSLLKRTALFFITLYLLSIAATLYFNLNVIYIAVFSIFSLGVLMALVKEYGKKESWLMLAVNVGVIGELLSIILMITLSSGLKSGFNMQFLITISILLGFLALFVLVFKMARVLFWWFPELKVMLMPYHDNKDIDIRLSAALMFILVALMIIIGIDQVLGAFLAGFFITSFFKHKTALPEKLSSFGFGFFVPLFFIHVGSTLPLAVFTDKEVLKQAFFVFAMIVSIRFISSLIAYTGYFGFKNTTLFSLGNSMPLTFLVAIATLAHNTKNISDKEYYAIVVASMISAVVLMITIKILHQYFFKKYKA